MTNPASVGVPGTPLLLEEMHARFGQLGWSELHDMPITLAAEGFPISPRLHVWLRDKFLKNNADAKKYFFSGPNDNLIPKNVGIILKILLTRMCLRNLEMREFRLPFTEEK